ncbi:uncharacterized protein STEHIDRAFT_150288 [Stereum hirsutum FP-91666 SS1]|uniref:uncharacterized protein n=1 Tax=Stereum hirsutum (strain FP-91666) TaxID=721885 RepID=UPI000444A31E|nr:uncharacterized protein STEHIDRAFT_150288 [Stereum hirsutum FP-91666 SS1]EIM81336.1 hypothetical protein STEHIDRAFT_150288 [Stereum hirsutum FP-91666 SS1]
MLPHQGAGAGVAIEDAYLFSSLLGEPSVTPDSLSIALEAYEHIRQPLAHHVQTGSRVSGQLYEFEFGEDYEALGPAIEMQWRWLWEGSAEEDVRRGLEWMRTCRDGGMQLT